MFDHLAPLIAAGAIRRRGLLGRHHQAPRRIASCFRLPLKLSVRLARSDGERDGTSPRIWAVGHLGYLVQALQMSGWIGERECKIGRKQTDGDQFHDRGDR